MQIEGKIVKPLCIILPQMSGYIKYFENGGENISFMVKDDDVLDKYNDIWEKIKNKLNIKLHCSPVYDKKYIKVKVKELGNKIPKENKNCSCIAYVTIDSVMRIEKKNYLQVFLEEGKYKAKKKTKISKFIKAKLESDLESEPESASKSNTGLMTKLEPNSDSDSE